MGDCRQYTSSQLAAFLAGGGTVLSGPYSLQADCLAGCAGSSSSSAPCINNACCDCVQQTLCLTIRFDENFFGPTCPCMGGRNCTLTYDSGTGQGTGSFDGFCGGTWTFAVWCDAGTWRLIYSGPTESDGCQSPYPGIQAIDPIGGATCDPFHIQWTFTAFGCTGFNDGGFSAFRVTITPGA